MTRPLTEFDPGGQAHRTANGLHKAKVLYHTLSKGTRMDGPHQPLAAVVYDSEYGDEIHTYYLDGVFRMDHTPSGQDLCNDP